MNKQSLTEEQRRIACAERTGFGPGLSRWLYTDHIKGDPSYQNNLGRVYLLSELPNPEHSPADALALVEWMEKDGWVWQMQSRYQCTFFHAECLPTKYETSVPTFCAAIVLAFLAATD